MAIYHLEFAKTGLGSSGGETYMIEQIKSFSLQNVKNIILTTDNGKESYEKLGIKESEFIKYKIIDSYKDEQKYHIFISYILRLPKILKLIKNIAIKDEDVIFCHSEFFPNSIPSYILSRKNYNSQLFYWFHMLCPNIFKGYEGEFTNRYKLPSFAIIHYKLNQILYRLLTPKRAIILTVNNYYLNILNKKYPNKIFSVNQIDENLQGKNTNIVSDTEAKDIDILWMGRFHSQKGLLELPNIVQIIKKTKNNIKVVIVGDGDEGIKNQLLKDIKSLDLETNITLKGFISDQEEKNILLDQTKVFAMTSFYESLGLVSVEAMTNGIPVVAYDLPVFSIFEKGMIKVKILDNNAFAHGILELLDNQKFYNKISVEARVFSQNFNWDNATKNIFNQIKIKNNKNDTTKLNK